MTERIMDLPAVSIANRSDTAPSAVWFAEQGRRFMQAQRIVQDVSVVPDELRRYRDETEEGTAERATYDMALDVVKTIRGCSRFTKYGIDTDLYTLEVKRLSSIRLGARATAAYTRSL